MLRTQIQIEDRQVKWLKRHALGKGISMSQLIRDCIDYFRTHEEHSHLLVKNRQKALTAVGSFTSKKETTPE